MMLASKFIGCNRIVLILLIVASLMLFIPEKSTAGLLTANSLPAIETAESGTTGEKFPTSFTAYRIWRSGPRNPSGDPTNCYVMPSTTHAREGTKSLEYYLHRLSSTY